jgi:hypothetical protein
MVPFARQLDRAASVAGSGVVRVDIDTGADVNDGRVGKITTASNLCINHRRLPNPLGQCHCGQPSLPIAVNSHIDDVGVSLNDGITSRRSESGISFISTDDLE